MITIDNDGVMKLADKLEKMSGRAIPYATRSALNKAAFFARGEAQEVIGRNMIERNKWTRRSVMVQTAKGLNINKQESEVGSVQDYMETQEYGGTVTGRGKTKPIPTGYAAGQDGQRKRTKVPTRVNKMRNIRVGSRNRRNTLFQSAIIAANAGDKFFKTSGRKSAIYRVWGKRKRKGQWTRVKMRMVYDMSRRSVRVPKSPWLAPAIKATVKAWPRILKKEIILQLRRLR